ncbi:GvpL/GvpF family gas vesicle protein [Pseudorhodobacter sp. MZDSW-24AT]|uniref:GvpL/GvpF family gas vesicle protein n=1 Tax=Pseudorhodobacter sp. MZDSW-24AT TaxID=2052957 RepID=UPI000C1DD25D|nr:GvpL/GvpF family gas vesicle protein [Pseudorhodobacter sp. MZDSW-24AT]PJF08883.1 gas vesicle protein [Pseudorhodobacter sp. MZDSW-24AT]
MIYLYALIEDPLPGFKATLQSLTGLQGRVQLHPIGPWQLVFSEHGKDAILPKRPDLLTHTRVLEQLMPFGTQLPARFGMAVEDIGAVERMIRAKSALLAEQFTRVRGCIELGIRIRFARPLALGATLADDARLIRERDRLARLGPDAQLAWAEFGGKLADRLDRRRGAAQQALCRKLLPLCRAHVLRVPEEDVEVLRAEFLLPAEGQSAFLTAVEEAAAQLDFAPGAAPEIKAVGPVPVYNFVRLNLMQDDSEEVT